jgi:hypothetical protein
MQLENGAIKVGYSKPRQLLPKQKTKISFLSKNKSLKKKQKNQLLQFESALFSQPVALLFSAREYSHQEYILKKEIKFISSSLPKGFEVAIGIMAETSPGKDESFEAFNFILSVIDEHDKDLAKIVKELASIAKLLGGKGGVSGILGRIEDKLDNIHNDLSVVLKALSI